MLKIGIVVFRESMEIVFLVSMIAAIIRPIKYSNFYITIGVILGILVAGIFAIFAQYIFVNEIFDQDILNAVIILSTSIIIAWTVIWMQEYRQKLKGNFSHYSYPNAIEKDKRYAIAMIVFLVAISVFREGVEIILFLYGIIFADNLDALSTMLGFLIGLIPGISIGIIICRGLLKLNFRIVFNLCTYFMILISAGLAVKFVSIMSSSGIITKYTNQIWDSSWLISDYSIAGKILNATVGYTAKPTILEIITYFSVIIAIFGILKFKSIATCKIRMAKQQNQNSKTANS